MSSILSGLAEASILILMAEVGTTIAKGAKTTNVKLGPLSGHHSLGTLFIVAGSFALVRLALQVPASVLPARIAAEVQSSLRTKLFHAFTRASWDVQSRDREGHLQETMTSQVIQATGGVLQATTLLTALFTFTVLMGTALYQNPLAAAGSCSRPRSPCSACCVR